MPDHERVVVGVAGALADGEARYCPAKMESNLDCRAAIAAALLTPHGIASSVAKPVEAVSGVECEAAFHDMIDWKGFHSLVTVNWS